MAIPNVNLNPPASNPISSIVNNAVTSIQPSANQPASATVTLSAQGQQLSQSQTNPIQLSHTQASQPQASQSQTNQTQTSSTVDTPATPNVVPQSKETTAAPGIQFMSGESKGGHVNTFA